MKTIKSKTSIYVEREIQITGTYHRGHPGSHNEPPEGDSIENLQSTLDGEPLVLEPDEIEKAEQALIESAIDEMNDHDDT